MSSNSPPREKPKEHASLSQPREAGSDKARSRSPSPSPPKSPRSFKPNAFIGNLDAASHTGSTKLKMYVFSMKLTILIRFKSFHCFCVRVSPVPPAPAKLALPPRGVSPAVDAGQAHKGPLNSPMSKDLVKPKSDKIIGGDFNDKTPRDGRLHHHRTIYEVNLHDSDDSDAAIQESPTNQRKKEREAEAQVKAASLNLGRFKMNRTLSPSPARLSPTASIRKDLLPMPGTADSSPRKINLSMKGKPDVIRLPPASEHRHAVTSQHARDTWDERANYRMVDGRLVALADKRDIIDTEPESSDVTITDDGHFEVIFIDNGDSYRVPKNEWKNMPVPTFQTIISNSPMPLTLGYEQRKVDYQTKSMTFIADQSKELWCSWGAGNRVPIPDLQVWGASKWPYVIVEIHPEDIGADIVNNEKIKGPFLMLKGPQAWPLWVPPPNAGETCFGPKIFEGKRLREFSFIDFRPKLLMEPTIAKRNKALAQRFPNWQKMLESEFEGFGGFSHRNADECLYSYFVHFFVRKLKSVNCDQYCYHIMVQRYHYLYSSQLITAGRN